MILGETMNIIEIITKKKDKKILSKKEIFYVIESYVQGKIEDYQMSSLLMAICINGMTGEETSYLTEAMLKSGDEMNLSFIEGKKVDKHSTGGVGDKTTLVLAPLVASCQVPVAKMSGRGLGFTGGTIDKLESIQGFQTALKEEEFKKQVKEIGVAIASQTGNLAPADKKIYALRDVSGTVESIPLIASSIMSKKLASGADQLVMDVKVGKGALMKTLKDAEELAHTMISIGNHHKKDVCCFLTNMKEPLGYAVGNGLEVLEAIETLKGNGPKDLEELTLTLAAQMISMGKSISFEEAKKEAYENLKNGNAYQKFLQLVQYQHGNIQQIALSEKQKEICSPVSGYLHEIDPLKIGMLVKELGAGRMTKEDKINYGVGIVLAKKVGDYVNKGDKLLTIYYEKEPNVDLFLEPFDIQNEPCEKEPLIYKRINSCKEMSKNQKNIE